LGHLAVDDRWNGSSGVTRFKITNSNDRPKDAGGYSEIFITPGFEDETENLKLDEATGQIVANASQNILLQSTGTGNAIQFFANNGTIELIAANVRLDAPMQNDSVLGSTWNGTAFFFGTATASSFQSIIDGALGNPMFGTGVTGLHFNTAGPPSEIIFGDGTNILGTFSVNGATIPHSVTADFFLGTLLGTALSLAQSPNDCSAGEFAFQIDDFANLTCSADGSSLTTLNASNLASGTVDAARLDFFEGRGTTATICADTPNFAGGTFWISTDDFDIYTSTAAPVGSWRNGRTGIGACQ